MAKQLPRISKPLVASSYDAALAKVKEYLYAEVVTCTIGLVRGLTADLATLGNTTPGPGAESELVKELLNLTSESLRGGLHYGEIPITNALIHAKNKVLRNAGVEIPESHQPINAADYANKPRW